MKTNIRIITVTLIALAAASMFAVNTVAAREPVPGQLVDTADLAFLQSAGNTGIRTPVADATPVGLFSVAENRYLVAPYAPVTPRGETSAPEAIPGLMISDVDLYFIVGPGSGAGAPPETWAAGADRFGIGQ